MQVDSNSVNNVSFYSACKDALPVWKREFLSVRVERNVLVINREVLNVFQRMLRYLHLAYLDTIVDQTKINRWYAVDSTRTRAVVGALRARGKGGILPRNEGGINVLMAGRSRCGKSTLAKLLELPKITCSEDFPQDPSNGTIFRATRDPILLKPIHVLDSLNQSHTLHILDTPGLSELVPVGREKRSDDTILDSIETCASLEFGGQGLENVDVVLLPFSMGAGINKADIEAIKEFDKKVTETAKKTNKLIKISKTIARAWSMQFVAQHIRLSSESGRDGLITFLVQIP